MPAADAFRSSTTRAVGLKRRGDLVTTRQLYQGQAWWVVKDPIALSYFRFRPEEYALLEMLDGDVSLEQLKDRFEAKFPPRRIKLDELARFIATLHRSGLVIGDRPGQGPQLFERRRQRIWKQWQAWLGNILSLRFRGIDPDRILTRLDPWLGWLFDPPAIVAVLVFAASALLLVLVNFDVFRAKLPEFHQFFASGNWLYLAVALAITKILHEFGHGLSCKHYGGECHEMGMMLLVFTPCLYCDVSDSWMLPSKWKRAAIGAAGMYVEVLLASIATFLWWNSHGGIFNQLCLDVMFVSSVSTLLFNANPLLRYDGYYILSDLLEIPNLKQKSTAILGRLASHWCLGIKPPDDPFLPQRRLGLFALYSVASSLYGWFVSLSIFLFVWTVFKPYRLEVIGQVLGFMALWGLVVRPVQGIIKFLNIPGRRDEVKAVNLVVTAVVAAGIAAAIALIPLPQRVWCGAELRPRGEETVYVTEAGRLESLAVKAGAIVAAGDELARLSSIDLDLQITELEGKATDSRTRLASLERERFTDPAAGLGHPAQAERRSASAVVGANAGRVQEALRVLEEFGRCSDPELAEEAAALRYLLYDLEVDLLQACRLAAGGEGRRELLARCHLYLVTSPVPDLEGVVAAALEAGVRLVQYRAKEAAGLDDLQKLNQARALRQLCAAHGALFLVNDRIDIALAVEADGVHLGQGDLPPALARQLLGPDRLVGRSTHALAQLQQAITEGCDYVGVGPVHATPTKPGREAVGLDYVRQAAAISPIPFFAIGGVDATNLAAVRAAGADRVAVVRAITEAGDPAAATTQLLAALEAPLP